MDTSTRLNTLLQQISKLPFHADQRRECMQLLHNLENMAKEINKASVESRRRKKLTQLHKDLLAEFDIAADNLEKLVILARLCL